MVRREVRRVLFGVVSDSVTGLIPETNAGRIQLVTSALKPGIPTKLSSDNYVRLAAIASCRNSDRLVTSTYVICVGVSEDLQYISLEFHVAVCGVGVSLTPRGFLVVRQAT